MNKTYTRILRYITLLITIGVALTGCSGSTGGTTGADTTSPTVISTSILDNAIGISEATTSLTADFSEPMDASTLTPLSFTLSGPNGTIPATVSYSSITATMNISSGTLDYSTIYIARISTAAKDVAGNGLAADSVWRFTTRQSPDVIAPRVSSTNPANGASGVTINSALNAVFSEPLDCTTVNASSFLVDGGAAGTVNCNDATATFTLTASLANTTTYTATMTTSVKDLAGNALAANYIWSFTTGAAADTTAPQLLSTNPADGVTGITVNSKLNATFSESLDCSTLDTSSFRVTGPSGAVTGDVDCSGDTATFSPTSNLEFDADYTATITTDVQDLATNPLAANYSWSFATGTAPDTRAPQVSSTNPANSATGIDINNLIEVVFSEPMDPTSITTASFTLGDPSGNVAGTVSYSGTRATFTPATSLDSSTIYNAIITTSATDLAGNAITANYGWSFTTTAAADSTAPTVVSTTPLDGATGTTINSIFTAIFSEPLDCTTVDASSFSIDNGVSGNVSCNSNTVTFTPNTDLAYSTAYTATLSTAITDIAGLALASSYDWTVNTGVAPDNTAPQVSSTSPADSATGVSITTTISAVFDKALDCATIDTSSFSVNNGVTGSVSCSGSIATFIPGSALNNSTSYTATITTAVQDLAGNPLAASEIWSFETEAAADLTSPTVVSTTPAGGATNITNNTLVTAVFSEQLDCSTVTSNFSLDNGATGAVSCSNSTTTFTPDSALAYSTVYTVTITSGGSGVKDLAGNALAADYIWSFTIEDAPDLTGPVVSSRVPANLATDVVTTSIPTANFDEALDCSTVNSASFTLTTVGPVPVAGNVSCSGDTASFTPTANLEFGEQYTATLTTDITDILANSMAADDSWSFTTLIPPWIKQFGSSSYDDARAVAVDQTTGDVYLAGATLGGIDGNTNAGGWDLFLSKYNALGVKQWTVQLGTSTDDNVRDITVDSSGNVYLTGYSGGSIVDSTVNTTIDSFLVKYDSNGTFQWAKSIGTSLNDIAHGVVTDASDNVYMAGYTYGNLLSSAINNGADLFLIKYDSSGAELWRSQYGNSTDDLFISGIDIDTSNNLYLSGSTFGTLTSNPPLGGEDAFLIKYDADGNRQWIRQFGGSSDDSAAAVAIDTNIIYVVGRTQDALGSEDLYLTKFDNAGIILLSKQLGNSGIDDIAYDIAVVSSGDIYVTGYTDGSLGENLSSGGQDMILVKFDSNLNNTWNRQLGTGENDIGYSIASDSTGNVFIGGYTLGTLEHNVNSGLSDAFVVKYNASGIRQ